ncbi:MAG TPA: two-component regulator propeller domain-containing protein [Candidatus Sulfopaludibacter sp.]|nr:two-component regulator propeller domain-containing protein [Candidatus Sulfopaludibacter sp.]
MPKKCWLLQNAGRLLCVFAPFFSGTAGAANPPNSPFIVDAWGTEQGLPGSAVISVTQTRDGYLWLGTLNGLVRFDGIHFTVFDENNTPGLGNDRIVCLFEDSHTNLWIGTDSGTVAMEQGGGIRNFSIGRNNHDGRLVSACEDASGTVWLYTADAHLARYQNGKMDVLDFNFKTPAVCRMIAAEKSGLVWVGEDWGLFSFRPSNFNPPAFAIEQWNPVQQFNYLLASQHGGTWRLMEGHVQKWGSTRLEKDFGPYPWGNAIIKDACEDKNGNLVVGTLGAGVFWYDPNGNYRQISTEQGLSSAYALSLCLDQEGNLWVGTDGGGLDRIKRKIFNTPEGLHPWNVQSLSEDAHEGLWIAFGALGAAYWKTNSVQYFQVGPLQDAWTMLADHRQRVWAGTRDEGLFQFETNQFHFAPKAEILGPQISALFEDPDGQLWVGTPNGLGCWNGQAWKMYTFRDGLSGNAVSAITKDTQGNLWIGTQDGGLSCFKDGKFISYPASENGLPGNDISCLYVDTDGALWIGTSGHGLARFHGGKWTRFSKRDGLVSNSISYIIGDAEGDLWIGSNLGLMRIPETLVNDSAGGTVTFSSCRVYGQADGLPTRECSSGSQPAAGRTSDGRLWFPTTRGLVDVNPVELKPNLQPPLVKIESVLVNGREQKTNRFDPTWPQAIVIPPGHNQLNISYTALNYSAPNEVRFKYWLEGRDNGWTDARDTRVAFYNELPPGNYQFQVQACNEDGVWNKTGSVLAVTVRPHFWQTGWFRAFVVLGFLGAVAAVVRYLSTQKLHRQLQALQQREALEKERSRIARDLHDQLGANLTQVALLGEMAEADKNSPEDIASHAQQISQTARETTHSLDEIVWAVNPSNDTLDGLITYVCKYAQEYLTLAGLHYRAEVPAQLPSVVIPPEVRHNVFLALKEAVNNVVKHARATEARIRLRMNPDEFTLEIEDDGRGIGQQDAAATRTRNGLRNMRKRMEDIHGGFTIVGGARGGTVVRLVVPVTKK